MNFTLCVCVCVCVSERERERVRESERECIANLTCYWIYQPNIYGAHF